MDLHIVTHCYAFELPHYAVALKFQLSSLVMHRPTASVCIEVCYVSDDQATGEVLAWFCCHTNLDIRPHTLTLNQISRRCIGRNIAALKSEGDLVWFTDVDHIFGHQCIDSVLTQWNEVNAHAKTQGTSVSMVYPQKILISKDHSKGDEYLSRTENMLEVRHYDFTPKRYDRAIGGVQIVSGDFARKHGYLDGNEKFQTPLNKPFSSFSDDVAYRTYCRQYGEIVPINVPNLFRIRHLTTTYQ